MYLKKQFFISLLWKYNNTKGFAIPRSFLLKVVFVLRGKQKMIGAGLIIGIIAAVLVLLGNPKNMGFCIACFIRDTAGAVGLHQAAAVQYIRPEIIGLVLGAFVMLRKR